MLFYDSYFLSNAPQVLIFMSGIPIFMVCVHRKHVYEENDGKTWALLEKKVPKCIDSVILIQYHGFLHISNNMTLHTDVYYDANIYYIFFSKHFWLKWRLSYLVYLKFHGDNFFPQFILTQCFLLKRSYKSSPIKSKARFWKYTLIRMFTVS